MEAAAVKRRLPRANAPAALFVLPVKTAAAASIAAVAVPVANAPGVNLKGLHLHPQAEASNPAKAVVMGNARPPQKREANVQERQDQEGIAGSMEGKRSIK